MDYNGRVIELNEAPYADGRREITIMLHEIYPDETRWNRNGICWLEPYVRDNAESVKGMPFCVRYWDEERGIPYDHGFDGVQDGMPVYTESYVVGVANEYDIREVEIDGETAKVLCAKGVLYQQRYPRFVKWLEESLESGEAVYSSIEIVPRRGSDAIIYKDGWKEHGRVPTQYVYSGHAFLTVKPADDKSLVIELNENRDMEVEEMDEKMMNQIADFVWDRVKPAIEKNEEIHALEATHAQALEAKDQRIAELESEVEKLKDDIVAKESELENAKEAAAAKETAYNQVVEELNKCKERFAIAELSEMLKDFSEQEQACAKEEIDAYKADPLHCGQGVESIRMKIESCAYRAQAEQKRIMEQNEALHLGGVFSFVEPPKGNENEEIDLSKAFGN